MAGNSPKIYTDYDEAINTQIRAIDSAKDYIHVEYFIIALDTTTQPFFDAMERAVKRGVKVRVLFDGVVSRPYPKFKKMKQHLDMIGVEWYQMLPLNLLPGPNFTRPDLRNHRKLVVIDGKIGFSGSQNLIQRNYHRRDELVYEEIVIELTGPVVWQLNNVFRADWYAESGDLLKDLVEDNDMPKAEGEAIVQVLPSGPSHEHDNNLKLYTSVIHAAKAEVFIVVPYFVPDESLMTAITAAAQRGVKVTMINSEIIDKILVGHAQRSFYDELLAVGVRIYLYNKPVFLHNKHVRIDNSVVIVGSSNLDIRSFELNLEVNVVLYDKKAVAHIKDVEQKYIKKSKKVDKRSWSERPLGSKLLDRLSRLTAALQ
jgi:cardiolipin synthase